ncbi:MAG TPA: hypothetical protein VNZ49_00030 [Bacteroidia bacterium]|jgi:hypothetical protein|nr:hypothetical protein [Bacteroidia bacterium]
MRRILLAALFFFSLSAFSQKITSFSADTLKFIKELDAYFQEGSANKEDAAKFIDNFKKFWQSAAFSKGYKDYVYGTCNALLEKKLKPYPYFQNYLLAVANFISSKQNYDNFESWQTVLEKVLKSKNPKPIDNFLDMSVNLFEDGVFYKSPSFEWYTADPVYKFDYDSLPKLVFQEFILNGRNPRFDSIAIENTSGTYYPTSGKFYGKGGKVSWKRTGLGDDVYATIKKYTIDCKTGAYVSDSVLFYDPQYFDKPQKGRLNDKIISQNDGKLTYPRFDTYTKRLEIKSIIKDVYYDGGFSMRGPQFVGSGDVKNPAKIIIKRNNQRFLEVSARNFTMNSEKITSENAAVKFYLEKDSMYHPGCNFKYLADQRKVSLIRTDEGLQKTPFSDSYHKVDMYFEELTWKIDSPKIDIGFLAANLQGQAYFESQDFFTMDRFSAIKGDGNDVNPILKINQFYEYNNKQLTFNAVELAKYMKWTAVDLRPVLVKIATFGVVNYNVETDEVTIKEKLFKYIKAAKKLTDYDILTFHSVFPGSYNATINLLNNNFDMRIRGVKQILISDTQKVFVFPARQEVVLKKGRSFTFSGAVASGKFEFHGKEFVYDYDQNKINMKLIDSLRIYVSALQPEPDGSVPFKRVQTVIESISGELDVDHPKNHAGYIKMPQYPIFKSFKESYAYYDKKSIQKGVYNRDNFYFKLDPFTIDSLDNFENSALKFKGEFSSSGIFPVFRDTITLQKDYSLGFIRKTPPGGFNAYGVKGKFDNEIRLSNKGLRGGGDITFGPSITKGDDFIFFPDSTNGIANTFDVKEQESPIEFPQAHGDKVYIHWTPKQDLLQAYNTDTPFSSYNKKVEFRGRYDLTINELRGRGKADFEKADLISRDILFKQQKFYSDTADFHLKAMDDEGFTFATDNVNAIIDFVNRSGTFVTNGSGSVVRFPKNDYISYMDRFKWFMDQESIQLGDENKKINLEQAETEDVQLEAPQFISVKKGQDSLSFFAPAARYNLRKYIINCLNVPFINIADARIYPDSGKITIYKNAVMDTLKNAILRANTVTKYHTVRNVKANVFGRKSYLASGDYTYLDENDKPYNIRLAKIYPDTTGQTVSEGSIPEKENFKFNDYFSFAGQVYLKASNQFLYYVGGTRIVHSCSIGKSYLKFEGEIDPKEILIPIPKTPKDMAGVPVACGIIYSPDSNMVYSSFLSQRISGKNDKDVLMVDGFLGYDKDEKEYRISNKEKLVETSLPGNYLSLGTANCQVYGEGKLDIGADFGQMKVTTVGNIRQNTINDSTKFDLMMVLDFFFEKSAIKKMAADFELLFNTLTPTDFSRKTFEKGIIEILGKERGDKALSELNLYGNYKRFPDEIEKTIFISDVQMIYNPKLKAFVSVGDIGVANILKNEIYRYTPGLIQIKKQKNGDIIDIYFELDPNTWYYFSYFRGVMSAVSSNQEFNKIISELKSKDRKLEVKDGPSYQFTPCSPTKKDQFVKKLRAAMGAKSDEE